ncbi:hypothetical protein B2G69_03730 [Methylorubrum zatmanii]|nr:hypothetical protein [Methylorubrum zatmanii]ARO53353.1 hypothetical protein B2G69_03730 [Methylorubrum zatmanii]
MGHVARKTLKTIDQFQNELGCPAKAAFAWADQHEKSKSNALAVANRLMPGIVFAGHRSIFLLHHVLEKFAEHDPVAFLAMLEHAMADESTRRNLATMVRSGHRDPEIQELIEHHRPTCEGRVIESVERSLDSDHAVTERFENDVKFRMKVVQDVAKADPEFVDRIFEDLRSGKFRDDAETVSPDEFEGSRRKLTVAEARRRVMAHTGQSERAVIRDTRGWSADRIISLIA